MVVRHVSCVAWAGRASYAPSTGAPSIHTDLLASKKRFQMRRRVRYYTECGRDGDRGGGRGRGRDRGRGGENLLRLSMY